MSISPKEAWLKTPSNNLHKWTAVQAVGMVNDHLVTCFRYVEGAGSSRSKSPAFCHIQPPNQIVHIK
jgi:hypothetical protein